MNKQKERLRQRLQEIRQAMLPDEVDSNSLAVTAKLMSVTDWSKIKKVHVYRSINAYNEVNTDYFINEFTKSYPKIKIVLGGKNKNEVMPAEKFDLIVVPVLGFDTINHRLGFGGGWYDRFLATQPQALKIGLCFHNGFIKKGLLHEPHDVPLDKIITEV